MAGRRELIPVVHATELPDGRFLIEIERGGLREAIEEQPSRRAAFERASLWVQLVNARKKITWHEGAA